MSFLILTACLAVLVLCGGLERLALDRARSATPIRIHVNGTRGKSTVTRLIHAALGEAGIPALGKTTGTSPRLLLPDGAERIIRRRGPANIREQVHVLRAARRLGARAIVVECMAIRPDLQWTAEHDMLRSTIGVITNVRDDHGEVMGASLREIAASLAGTIPRDGVLVTGDRRFLRLFEERAAAVRARVVVADAVDSRRSAGDSRRSHLTGVSPQASESPASGAGQPGAGGSWRSADAAWLREDVTIALAVTRLLGIDDRVALAGMGMAHADPGQARSGAIVVDGVSIRCLDATAANDPDSLEAIVHDWTASLGLPRDGLLVVFNHRSDRGRRLRSFSATRTITRAAGVLVTGDRPDVLTWRLLRARCDGPVAFARRPALPAALALRLNGKRSGVLFCGNTRGFDSSSVMTAPSIRESAVTADH